MSALGTNLGRGKMEKGHKRDRRANVRLWPGV
jgi:hypothetical protein